LRTESSGNFIDRHDTPSLTGVAQAPNVPQSCQLASSSTQDGMKRVAQLSPSSMYDIEDIDIRRTLQRRRHKIFTLPARVASYSSQWGHVSTSLVPPSSRRCGFLRFPPGTRAKALLRRSVIPKLIERLFLMSRSRGRIADHEVGIGCDSVVRGSRRASVGSLCCSGRTAMDSIRRRR
jgi:hypothetical protein